VVVALDQAVKKNDVLNFFVVLKFVKDHALEEGYYPVFTDFRWCILLVYLFLGIAVNLPPGAENTLGLEPLEKAPTVDVFARLLKTLSNKPMTQPCVEFKSSNGFSSLACSHRTNSGFLYGMRKSFLFVSKPVVYVRHEDIACVGEGSSPLVSSVFFRVDPCGRHLLRSDAVFRFENFKKTENNNVVSLDFNQIDRRDFQPLVDFCQFSGLKIKNLKEGGKSTAAAAAPTVAEEGERSGENKRPRRNAANVKIFSTRFECKYSIFSTRFECKYSIFSTRFECSFSPHPRAVLTMTMTMTIQRAVTTRRPIVLLLLPAAAAAAPPPAPRTARAKMGKMSSR
jgi:hypothetical protein